MLSCHSLSEAALGSQVGTLHCVEGFHSRNGHTVLIDSDSRGPVNLRILYPEAPVPYTALYTGINVNNTAPDFRTAAVIMSTRHAPGVYRQYG